MQKTQFSSGDLLFNEKLKKPFVSLSFIIRIITLISCCCSLAQAIKVLNGADVNLFCRDIGAIQGWWFFRLFLYLFHREGGN